MRPIAVGYTWRRLAGKVASRRVADRAAALLAPRQLGFAVPGGAEAAVHATRRYISDLPSGHVFVKVDFTNAFNTIRRDVVLEAVSRHLPELLPYALSAYSAGVSSASASTLCLRRRGSSKATHLGLFYSASPPMTSLLQWLLR